MNVLDENTLVPVSLLMSALYSLWRVSRAVTKFESTLEHNGKAIEAVTKQLNDVDKRLDAHEKMLDHHAGMIKARRRSDRVQETGEQG